MKRFFTTIILIFLQLKVGVKVRFHLSCNAGRLEVYFDGISLRGWIACTWSSAFMGELLVNFFFLVFVQFICYNVRNYLYISKVFKKIAM